MQLELASGGGAILQKSSWEGLERLVHKRGTRHCKQHSPLRSSLYKVVHFMQLYHVTVYTFPVHFLIHNVILSKCEMCGLIAAVEAAGVFSWIANQSDQLAG